MKKCNKCKIKKEVIGFYNTSTICKTCIKSREKVKRDNDPIVKIRRQKLVDKVALFKLDQMICSKCNVKKSIKDYSSEPKGWNRLRSDCNFCKNKRISDYNAKTGAKRDYMAEYLKDSNNRLADNLRSRLRKAIKNDQKVGSAISDLGCSIEELKKHLEDQFAEGMTWDNYGLKGWHIDHIKPLAKYNLSNPEEFKEACNYKNLQPLWAKDNLKKGAKYD